VNEGSSAAGIAAGQIRVNSGVAATINSAITGSIGLTKTNAGTLVLGGSNTYSGPTNVNGGILAFSAAQTSLTGTINVASGATLRFDVNEVFGSHTSTSAPTIVVNGGTVTNLGNTFNTFQNLTLNSGTLGGVGGVPTYRSWSVRGTVTSSGNSTINPAGTNAGFILGQDGSTTFNVIDNTLTIGTRLFDNTQPSNSSTIPTALVKTGVGFLVLTQDNAYTGGTTISNGIVVVNDMGALGTGNVAMNGAGQAGQTNESVATLAFSLPTGNLRPEYRALERRGNLRPVRFEPDPHPFLNSPLDCQNPSSEVPFCLPERCGFPSNGLCRLYRVVSCPIRHGPIATRGAGHPIRR
jgi:autotransporter-associated beta strand protein